MQYAFIIDNDGSKEAESLCAYLAFIPSLQKDKLWNIPTKNNLHLLCPINEWFFFVVYPQKTICSDNLRTNENGMPQRRLNICGKESRILR